MIRNYFKVCGGPHGNIDDVFPFDAATEDAAWAAASQVRETAGLRRGTIGPDGQPLPIARIVSWAASRSHPEIGRVGECPRLPGEHVPSVLGLEFVE